MSGGSDEEVEYNNIWEFYEGVSAIGLGGEVGWSYIDTRGRTVWEPVVSSASGAQNH